MTQTAEKIRRPATFSRRHQPAYSSSGISSEEGLATLKERKAAMKAAKKEAKS